MSPIIIAIDGYSSCGKSTLAKDLARALGYRYIDTGAMYRAVTYHLIESHITLNDLASIKKVLPELQIDFEYDSNGKQILILNGENVETFIRQSNVSEAVSTVSAIHDVRQQLVRQQQKLGETKRIVMDGRDIGTVVFPNAELKIFMTADPDVRVLRRYNELKQMGIDLPLEKVKENLSSRDYLDANREESPLKKAEEAILLDNTHLTQEQQLEFVLNLANRLIGKVEK